MTPHNAKSLDGAPRCVLVMPFKVVSWAYQAIMPYMRENFGTRFVVIAHEGIREDVTKNWCGENDKVLLIEDIEAGISSAGSADTDAIARANEEKYDITYMRDVIQQDRQLSTSFLSHAPWSPYAAMPVHDRDALTKKLNGLIALSEKIIEDEGVDLMLVWPMTDLSACLAHVAAARNIPVTYPYVSSHKGMQFWSSSAFSDDSQHRAAYENQPDAEPVPLDEVAPPASPFPELEKMDASHSMTTIIREIARLTFFRLEFLVLDLLKFDFKIKKRTSYYRTVLQHLYKWWFYKKFSRLAEKDLKAFSPRPFLYFGLALEPEFSVQGKTKEYNDQASIIRQLAMSLPAGYDLVIKEHAALGRRHLSFYEDLLKFPNIRMAHPSVRGIDLATNARAVATLAGTVTLEATLLGKPAIEFSTHSVFSFLPNVSTVTSFYDLPGILQSAMRETSDRESEEFRQAGARTIRAIEDISFDGAQSPTFGGDGGSPVPENLERMVQLLVELYRAKTGSALSQARTG